MKKFSGNLMEEIYKNEETRKYDEEIADHIKEKVLMIMSGFYKLNNIQIKQFFLIIESAGCTGKKIEILKQKTKDPFLRDCFKDIVEILDENDAGVLLLRLGRQENPVCLERKGTYYFKEYIEV